MATQDCAKCSAALALGPRGSIVKCHYCGTDNRLTGVASSAGTQGPAAPAAPRPQSKAVIPIVLGIAGVGLAGAVALSLSPGVSSPSPSAAAQSPDTKPIPVSELATTSRHSTEVIPPPNLVGDLKTFDITANLDWVTAIARGWSADARLSYMQADEVGSDGIASKPVIFQFISPEQVATYQRGAATQDGEVVYRLHVEIGEGTVVVRFLDGRPELDESPPEGTWCALPLAFETALEQQSIPVRPNYRALGGFSVSGTTFWQISTQSNSHSVSLGPDCQLK